MFVIQFCVGMVKLSDPLRGYINDLQLGDQVGHNLIHLVDDCVVSLRNGNPFFLGYFWTLFQCHFSGGLKGRVGNYEIKIMG